MRIGVAFGCYCPLHTGHLDLIMKAKKENDMCFVFVCGYDGDRGGSKLPLAGRYKLISDFLSDEKLTVLKLNDTELGIDVNVCDSNWSKWLDYTYSCMEKCGADADKDVFTWYVGEERYRNAILKYREFANCVLVDREKNPISGTLCRNHPMKYWDQIATPFRAYFSHNILITGTASEGKTTLTCDIGKYFNIPYAYEKGIDNRIALLEDGLTVKEFVASIYEHQKQNEELIRSPHNPGVFISDTDHVVTLMYANAYREADGCALTDSDYDAMYHIASTYIESAKWDKIFLFRPSVRDLADRKGVQTAGFDYNTRSRMYGFLKSMYDKFGYKYEELCGTYYENFCKVRNYIKELYRDSAK